MSKWAYSCALARKRLVQTAKMLSNVELLVAPPDDGMLHHCVHQCGPCGKKDDIKRCTGWETIVERGLFSFRPYTAAGHDPVRLELSAMTSFRREKPEHGNNWQKRPIASSTVTLEIIDVKTEALLERHHHDLANLNQTGPVWHLQYGGNPAGGELEKLPTSWLSPPRWSELPMDLTLLADAIAYNFFSEEWEKLNADGAWVNLIVETEQLVVSHFAEHIHAHFTRPPTHRDRTWLAAQDNRAGGMNPRPPQ